jgi:predicted DNA-binding transcriptional regulator YafY
MTPQFFVSRHGAPPSPFADLTTIRAAIRDERKLYIAYGDEKGARTQRTIWPFAIAYCAEATLVTAWCELRDDFRHFRADRILGFDILDEGFPVCSKDLFARWQERFGVEETVSPKPRTRSTREAQAKLD